MLIDSHVHLDSPPFDLDRAEVMARADASGVRQLIIPATDVASWPEIRDLCGDNERLFPAYGLHPLFLEQDATVDVDALSSWLAHGDAAAVGEIGLDHFCAKADAGVQMVCFRAQLKVAGEHDLPVIVHARRAVEEASLALRDFAGLRGVVHSFSGSWQQAERLWQMGFLLGIGGPVTYPRARRLRRLVAEMPLEYLLLESDAPDQPVVSHRGQRNEPARVVDVAQCIAELRGETFDTIAAATTANAQRLFRLPPCAA